MGLSNLNLQANSALAFAKAYQKANESEMYH